MMMSFKADIYIERFYWKLLQRTAADGGGGGGGEGGGIRTRLLRDLLN